MYKEKLVVYFDILGFKELVNNKLDDPQYIHEILTFLHGISSSSYKADSIAFSDSIIHLIDLKSGFDSSQQTFNEYLNVIISDISSVQMNMLLNYKILIRGAIAKGNIFYDQDKNILFGDGLINAYLLESKHAVFPRIIIDESIEFNLNDDLEWMDLTKDNDGNVYVDFIKWAVKLKEEKSILSKLKLIVEDELEKLEITKHRSIYNKYYWLLNKINEKEQENLTGN